MNTNKEVDACKRFVLQCLQWFDWENLVFSKRFSERGGHLWGVVAQGGSTVYVLRISFNGGWLIDVMLVGNLNQGHYRSLMFAMWSTLLLWTSVDFYRLPDLSSLTILPWHSRFSVQSHGLTTRHKNLTINRVTSWKVSISFYNFIFGLLRWLSCANSVQINP